MTGPEPSRADLFGGIERMSRAAVRLERHDIAQALGRLANRVRRQEWHLVVLGETSTGKSCLINSLLGAPLLSESPRPSTGSVVFVDTTGEEEVLQGILADGRMVRMERQVFQAAARGEGDWYALHASLPARLSLPRGVIVVDTPGYNSCLESHTRVLTEYVPNADAVVFLTNYRRGITQEDAEFLALVQKGLESDEKGRFFFAVNFCPSSEPDARVRSMAARLSKLVGREVELHSITASREQPRRLEASSLWKAVYEQMVAMDLPGEIARSAARIAGGFGSMLARDLLRHTEAADATDDHLAVIKQRISELHGLHAQARRVVQRYQEDLRTTVQEGVAKGVAGVLARAGAEIEESNRFTEMNTCADYVRMHLVPTEVESFSNDLAADVEKTALHMADELESIVGQAEEVSIPDHLILDRQPGTMLVTGVRDRAVKGGAELAAAAYLRTLGGAVGEKAGVVNLAKMVVKRYGKVVGKVYPRAVYDNMGRVLREWGVTASRAINAFAVVITEVVAYLWKVVTWKGLLRSAVARALTGERSLIDQIRDAIPFIRDHQEPIQTRLLRGYLDAVDECMAETRSLVDRDYQERIGVLEASLRTRAQHGQAAKVFVQEIQRELEAAAVVLQAWAAPGQEDV
jgi:hypothetical protein